MSNTVPLPSIHQIFVNSEILSGTGKPGNSIIVTFIDDNVASNEANVVTARVNELGSWVASIPQDILLRVDAYVSIVQVDKYGRRSNEIVTTIRPDTEMPVLGDIVYVIYQNDLPINNDVYTDFSRAQAEAQNIYGTAPVNPNQLVQVDYARDVIIRAIDVIWEDGSALVIVPGYTIIPSVTLSIPQPETFQLPSKVAQIINKGFYSVRSINWKTPQRPDFDDSIDVFQPRHSYSVFIELQAEEGYTFYGVRPWLVGLNSQSPILLQNSGESLTLRFDFPTLAAFETSNFNILASNPSDVGACLAPVMERPHYAKILEYRWQVNSGNPYRTPLGNRILFELLCLVEPNPNIDWVHNSKPGIFTVNGDAVCTAYIPTERGVFVYHKFFESV